MAFEADRSVLEATTGGEDGGHLCRDILKAMGVLLESMNSPHLFLHTLPFQQKLLFHDFCIANDADLRLIDEPVAGIDKDNFVKITKIVTWLKSVGKAGGIADRTLF